MQEPLAELYRTHFRHSQLPEDLETRCSPPLLLSPGPHWSTGVNRLLVVGQETMGWDFESGKDYPWPFPPIATLGDFRRLHAGVEALQHGYRTFDFGRLQPQNHGSPFFRAFRKLGEALDTQPLWTNLFRSSLDSGSVIGNATHEERRQLLDAQHGLLAREIGLLEPTAVVFFTGPNYDEALSSEFPDAGWRPFRDHEPRQLAQISSAQLPARTIRTYHPNFLSRSRRWAWLDEIAELLVSR